MALIRDAIRIDNWARAQHRDHTGAVRPEWCPLCRERQSRMVSDRCATCGHPSATHDYGSVASAEPCYQPGCSCQAFTRIPPEPEPPSPAAPGARPAPSDDAMAVVRQLAEVGRPPHPDIRPIVKAARAIVAQTVTPRPRYRLTPEGVIPCPTPSIEVTQAPTHDARTTTPMTATPSRPTSEGLPCSRGARLTTTSARPLPIRKRADIASAGKSATTTTKPRKRAGTLGALLDRLEAIGATFCPDCYAYLWPEHTHLTRGPIVPLGTVTLAEPCVVDGLDGQSELVTVQEREAA